jgi:hypothetical protein
LTAKADETNTTNWVVVEKPPGWQKQNPALSEKSVRSLTGKHVEVAGWLFYDTNPAQEPAKGTPWEVHPVTSITGMN